MKYILIAVLLLPSLSLTVQAQAPFGWLQNSSRMGEYAISSDGNGPKGSREVEIHSNSASPKDDGSLTQSLLAGNYLGQSIEIYASLRTQNVDGKALFFINAYNADGKIVASTAFHLKNSTGWINRKIKLMVPERADQIVFGIKLQGRGEFWASHFQFKTDALDGSAGPPDGPIHSAVGPWHRPVNLELN